ncbi:MAG: hypothetical protein IJN10_04020 [Firmicutes bacterium]|nr:hypothetical protein [Bacillota bacterium]
MKKYFFILLVLLFAITSCSSSKNHKAEQTSSQEEDKPDKLKVYAMADKVVTSRHSEGEYYYTGYTIGPFGPLANGIASQGYVLNGALGSFESEFDIELDVHYFYQLTELEEQLIQDREQGKSPDVVILDHRGWADGNEYDNVYRLVYDEVFYDVLSYMNEDEVYESEEYFTEVLNAGKLNNKQYLIPLTFNMNAIFTSAEDVKKAGVSLEDGMRSNEILDALGYACDTAEDGALVVNQLSQNTWAAAIIQDYWESTGKDSIDYENETVTLDRELFEDMAVFFKQYFQMNCGEEWELLCANARTYMNEANWTQFSTPGYVITLEDKIGGHCTTEEYAKAWLQEALFYYENSSLTAYRHSIAGQATALETLYTELDEQMMMIKVPMYEKENEYSAQVQMYGGVITESEYPYYGYQLLKYLMDQEYDPYYSIPINKKNAEKMLDVLCTSVYTLYLSLGTAWVEEIDFTDVQDQYVLQPMSQDTRNQLEYMLDHIGGAVMPQAGTYEAVVWHVEAYALGLESLEEAYENACIELEEYVKYLVQ